MNRLLAILFFSTLLTACAGVGAVFTGAGWFYDRHNLKHQLKNSHMDHQIDTLFEQADAFQKTDARVHADVFNYVVLLTGQVQTDALKQQATEMVEAIPETRRIINKLTVGRKASRWRRLKDSWITTKIKSKIIADDRMDPSKITVTTEKGTVYFLGAVSRAQADLAVSAALHTHGVRRVVKVLEYVTYSTKY